jgi:hypothetical protein
MGESPWSKFYYFRAIAALLGFRIHVTARIAHEFTVLNSYQVGTKKD